MLQHRCPLQTSCWMKEAGHWSPHMLYGFIYMKFLEWTNLEKQSTLRLPRAVDDENVLDCSDCTAQ